NNTVPTSDNNTDINYSAKNNSKTAASRGRHSGAVVASSKSVSELFADFKESEELLVESSISPVESRHSSLDALNEEDGEDDADTEDDTESAIKRKQNELIRVINEDDKRSDILTHTTQPFSTTSASPSSNKLIKDVIDQYINDHINSNDNNPKTTPSHIELESDSLNAQLVDTSNSDIHHYKCCLDNNFIETTPTTTHYPDTTMTINDNTDDDHDIKSNNSMTQEENLSERIWSFWDKLIAGIKCSQRDCSEAFYLPYSTTTTLKPLIEPNIIRRARKNSAHF
ncbi:unnamed protein product, partial [Anisakis simplex]|uniref:Rab3 GTPase-activating protein catalytic subunit n=1 Tax=Anisakis simplex TaxID=6269 RepID=A0A0M3JE69_ANISI